MGKEIFKILEDCINTLNEALEEIMLYFEPPQFHGKMGYRFKNPTLEHVCLLKGVKMISSLNASMVLLKAGYVQETGMIYRTIDDFSNEILFLMGNYPVEELKASQKAFIEDFFKEEFDIPEKPFLKEERRKTVPKRKVHATIAEILKEHVNPADHQKLLRIVADTLSGYVHGAYPHIMEMYGGTPPHFHMQGMTGTPRMSEWIKQAINYVYRTNQTFCIMAEKFRIKSIHEKLFSTLKHFEETTGCKPTKSPDKLLSKLKKPVAKKSNNKKERR